MKVEWDLSNYETKTDLKNATGIDTSSFSKKVDLAIWKSDVGKLYIDKLKNVLSPMSSLKSKVDKLDVDKSAPAPIDLSKLSDVVKNDVVKKDVYNAKIKSIEEKIPNITNLTTQTTLNTKINEVKVKIPSITNLVTNSSLNAKMNEVKGDTPNTTSLATTTALTAAEDNIPNVSILVKKTDYNTKIGKNWKENYWS